MGARTGDILEDIDIDDDTTASYLQRGSDKRRDIVVEVWHAAEEGAAAADVLPPAPPAPKAFDELTELIPSSPFQYSGLRSRFCRWMRTSRTSTLLMYFFAATRTRTV
eukprot:8178838-Pyramimonas_sp.AAC.1